MIFILYVKQITNTNPALQNNLQAYLKKDFNITVHVLDIWCLVFNICL